MNERKELFVLVVAADRVVAATLATVAQAGGYMAATTASGVAASRIAERMVIDAALIDLPTHSAVNLDAAVSLQTIYPSCHITLLCSRSQQEEARMLAEEAGLDCEFTLRPLSSAELLAQLAAAPGVHSEPERRVHVA